MKNDNWTYRYGPPLGSYNYHYYLTHPHRYFIELFDQTKWFIQRGSRGYADCDVWSIDWHLTSYMPRALRDLALQVHGTPIIDTGRPLDPNDPNDCDTLTLDEWKETIRYIAETFEVARQIEDYDIKDAEDLQRKMKRFRQGMAMFNEYFFNLWDQGETMTDIVGSIVTFPSFGVIPTDNLRSKPMPTFVSNDETNPKDKIGAKKPRLSLVPPSGLVYAALAMANGADKYGPYNWREKKVQAMIYLEACQRHLLSWQDGEENASDSGVSHLGHAIACLLILIDAKETNQLIDNRPKAGAMAALIEKYTKKS